MNRFLKCKPINVLFRIKRKFKTVQYNTLFIITKIYECIKCLPWQCTVLVTCCPALPKWSFFCSFKYFSGAYIFCCRKKQIIQSAFESVLLKFGIQLNPTAISYSNQCKYLSSHQFLVVFFEFRLWFEIFVVEIKFWIVCRCRFVEN